MSIEADTNILHEDQREALEVISQKYAFNTFVHFRKLSELSAELGIGPEKWKVLLKEWEYKPEDFLRENQRGNCVDFACFTQRALGAVGLYADIIGSHPSTKYTSRQREFMRYRHTSVVYRASNGLNMIEPGWKMPTVVPIEPVGEQVEAGPWKFKTKQISQDDLTQELVSPTGHVFDRSFGLQPLRPSDLSTLTPDLLRIPRKLEMLTPMSDNDPGLIIGFDPKSETLSSNIDSLPESFEPSDITTALNEGISEAYGFDIKEELTACLGLRKSLPYDYWVR